MGIGMVSTHVIFDAPLVNDLASRCCVCQFLGGRHGSQHAFNVGSHNDRLQCVLWLINTVLCD